MFIDSHAHIQLSQFNQDREAVLKRAKEADVSNILVIGFDMETSLGAVELAEKYSHIYATVGMHPHDAKDLTPDVLKNFRELAEHPEGDCTRRNGIGLLPRPLAASGTKSSV